MRGFPGFPKPTLGALPIVSLTFVLGCNLFGSERLVLPLSVSPSETTVTVGGQVQFEATGGSPPYVFSVAVNRVVGTIDSSLGLYTAPSESTYNQILVTDATGNSVTATVTVNSSLSLTSTTLSPRTGEAVDLVPSGGISPYSFALPSDSEAAVTSDGVFTPGWASDTWTVTLTDAVGATATLNLTRAAGAVLMGTTLDDSVTSSVRDSQGNLFLIGSTAGTFTGQTQIGNYDAFLKKIDSRGSELWTVQFGSSGYDKAWSLAIDSDDNIYVVGETSGTIGSNSSFGGYDGFVVSFDSEGTVRWSTHVGTSSTDRLTAIAIDNMNNYLYVGGHTSGAIEGANSGSSDIFVRQLSTSGTTGWTDQTGSAFADYLQGIALDPSGYVYVTGGLGYASSGTGTFNGINFPQFSQPAFVAKYSSSGTVLWTQIPTGNSAFPYSGYGLAADASGNLYVSFQDYGAIFASNYGAALLKLSTHDGSTVWSAKPTANYTGAYLRSHVILDAEFNPILAGHRSSYNTDAGEYFYRAELTKFSKSSGSQEWSSVTGDASNNSYSARPAMSLDGSSIFLPGFTNGILGGYSSMGGFDVFVTKFNTSGVAQ